MGRFSSFIIKNLANLKSVFIRFPNTVFFLLILTTTISLLIENTIPADEHTKIRLLISSFFGVFLSVALQFTMETFRNLLRYKWLLRAFTIALSVLYYFFMTSASKREDLMAIRIVVICFALLAYYLWISSTSSKASFPSNALIHFKACFISALYSLVLALGFIAIYFAVDVLLVNLDRNFPAHIFSIMGTFFFPIYYLSLLPDFQSAEPEMTAKREKFSLYPQVLEILVSYIAIPLVAIFTGVLAIYFIKIAITLKWPVGELGPMVLGYAAVGLLLYVLSGQLKNNFTELYKKLFPIMLIPVVCLQLYSVFIRVNAYGITESRYYLILFGIYSILCAVILIVTKGRRMLSIALFAAIFAMFSIIPPTDAFTLSRNSQVARVTTILERNSMFSDGKVVLNNAIPPEDKVEITNIMSYLYSMGHTEKLDWLPEDYIQYEDFKTVFGFEEYYTQNIPEEGQPKSIYAFTDSTIATEISGYDLMLKSIFYGPLAPSPSKTGFSLNAKDYTLQTAFTETNNVVFKIVDSSGVEVAAVSSDDLLAALAGRNDISGKNQLPQEEMTLIAEGNTIRIKILITNISVDLKPDNSFKQVSGEAYVLVGEID